MSTIQGNPYVGPRTFTRTDAARYFGREQEARDLLALVISQRLVLFYARSGAGKSSLLNTRLIPQLQKEGFVVLPTGRVGGDLPQHVTAVDNVYAFNLMQHLAQGLHGDRSPELAHVDLSTFLRRLTSDDGETWYYVPPGPDCPDPDSPDSATAPAVGYVEPNCVLIIDQFEEIVTQYPHHWPDREQFFRMLNAAMRANPRLWIVLTLREDFVAALDPYAPLLDDHLRARFYMQPMDYAAAHEAIERPAALAGRRYAPGVVTQLVDNLRTVRVQGATARALSEFVEPVQLQIVAYQLWAGLERTPGDDSDAEITLDDLQRVAGGRDLVDFVTDALAGFYVDSLADAQTVTDYPVSERRLRRWFGEQLITTSGTRGLVYQDEEVTGGMPNPIVRRLENRFLLRAETRAGGTWYELVHDRFVEPIQHSNAAWLETHANPVTAPAARWLAVDREPGQLLEGAALAAAQRFDDAFPDELNDDERAFLVESAREQTRRASAARRRGVLTVAALVVAGLMLALALFAVGQQRNAEAERRKADDERNAALAAESYAWSVAADSLMDGDPVAEMHLAIRALPAIHDPRPYVTPAEFLLTRLVQTSAEREFRQLSTEPLTQEGVTIGPTLDDPMLVAAGSDGLHLVRIVESSSATATTWLSPVVTVTNASTEQAAWNDAGSLLAGIGDDVVAVWRAEGLGAAGTLPVAGAAVAADCAAWQPGADTLALCTPDGLLVWSVLDDPAALRVRTILTPTVTAARWSPDGALVAGWSGGDLSIGAAAAGPLLTRSTPDGARIRDAQWSPDAHAPYLAVVDGDGGLSIWDSAIPDRWMTLPVGPWLEGLEGIEFIDQDRFLTWGLQSAVRVWRKNGTQVIRERILRDDLADERVQGVVRAPDEDRLLVLREDGLVKLWTIGSGEDGAGVPLEGHTKPAVDAAWHPTAPLVATAARDGTARVWDLSTGKSLAVLNGHTYLGTQTTLNSVVGVRWLDDRHLLTWGEDGTARVWAAVGDPWQESCRGAEVPDGPQRIYCRQLGGLTRSPQLLQWIDPSTLLGVERTGATTLNAVQFDVTSGARISTPLSGTLPATVASAGSWVPVLTTDSQTGLSRIDLVDVGTNGTPLTSVATLGSAEAVEAVAVAPQGDLAVVDRGDRDWGDRERTLAVWSPAGETESRLRWSLLMSTTHVLPTWSADGTRLVASTGEGIVVWDGQTGDLVWQWQPDMAVDEFDSAVWPTPIQVAFAPDETLLAVAQGKRLALYEVDLFGVDTRPLLRWSHVAAHNGQIQGLAWTSGQRWPEDGNALTVARPLLLTWGGDDNASLWDTASGGEIYRLSSDRPIGVAVISADGRQIATDFGPSAQGAGVRVWPRWEWDELLDVAQRGLPRPLSPEQQQAIEFDPAQSR